MVQGASIILWEVSPWVSNTLITQHTPQPWLQLQDWLPNWAVTLNGRQCHTRLLVACCGACYG